MINGLSPATVNNNYRQAPPVQAPAQTPQINRNPGFSMQDQFVDQPACRAQQAGNQCGKCDQKKPGMFEEMLKGLLEKLQQLIPQLSQLMGQQQGAK